MFYRLLLLAAVFFAAACSSKQNGPPPRFAVLRFENLTSDPSLNWMGRAASEVLIHEIGAVPSRAVYKVSESLGRRPIGSPGVSTELADALLAGGDHLIFGYFERVNGKLSFTAVEEDPRTGRTISAVTVQGAFFNATLELGRHFTAVPKIYPTRNETALRAYMEGIENARRADELFQQAIAADPQFPEPYLSWCESAASQRETHTLEQILAKARANRLGDAVLAKIEFERAVADQDPIGRNRALQRIVETDPADTSAVASLGESELNAHHFPQAASILAKSDSPEMINLRAYALMFGGDESNALNVIHDYQKARPDDANPIDSEGDIQFFFGHFAEAEKSYLRAAAKDPQFNQGGEVWKAARARLMTGDVAGATRIFNKYQQDRINATDPSIGFRAATWQYLTGDHHGAVEAAHKAADQSPNISLKALALAQAAIWELQMGRTQDAVHDAETVVRAGQTPGALAAAIVRFAVQDLASAADMEARAERVFNGNAAPALRQLAVGYALIATKRYEEAVPVWKRIYEESNPNDQSVAFLYAMVLTRAGHTSEAAPLLKFNPIPTSNLSPSFECFYLKAPGSTAAPAK